MTQKPSGKIPSKIQSRYFRPPRFSEGLRRFGPLAVLAYFVGFLIMGVVASDSGFQKNLNKRIPVSPAPFSLGASALEAAKGVHLLGWHYATHVPEPCADEGRAVNAFQKAQCGEFWDRLSLIGWVSSIPFLLAGGFLFLSWDGVRQRYRRARNRIQKGRSTGLGVVTDPPEGAPDRESWWYGLQPITVQVADGKQIVAYLPPEAPVPPPGEKVALYEWGKVAGKARFFAVLYAPHVAVLQGG